MRDTSTGRATYTAGELALLIQSTERTAAALERAARALSGALAPSQVAFTAPAVAQPTAPPVLTIVPAIEPAAGGRAIRPSDGKLGYTCAVSPATCGAITKTAKSAGAHGTPGVTDGPYHQSRAASVQSGREVR